MQKKIIYIECGITTRTKINTGIQRVVRNITSEAKKVGPQMGCEVVLVDFVDKKFNIIDKVKKPKNIVKIPFWFRLLAAIDRIFLNFYKFSFYSRIRIPIKSFFKKYILKQNSEISELKPFGADKKPSILILLDSNWNNDIWSEVDEFRQAGGKVCAVLYDLIPFTHPDTVDDITRIAHTSWWSEAPKHIDLVMCISNSVRDEFLDWQQRMSYSSPIPDDHVGYFHLGAELKNSDPVISLLSESEPYYLMVGSLEPRKNHKTVLDAFDRLWDEGRQMRLAIVGAYGWKSEDLLLRIQAHPLFNKKLFLIRDATDRDIVALYADSEALILASKAEGFGLPIIEAQKLNCKVICSDIPVFREVASDEMATFFNPLDEESLANIIRQQLNCKICKLRETNRKTWLSWRQSAMQLLYKIN